jgi:hypothetical protein
MPLFQLKELFLDNSIEMGLFPFWERLTDQFDLTLSQNSIFQLKRILLFMIINLFNL